MQATMVSDQTITTFKKTKRGLTIKEQEWVEIVWLDPMAEDFKENKNLIGKAGQVTRKLYEGAVIEVSFTAPQVKTPVKKCFSPRSFKKI